MIDITELCGKFAQIGYTPIYLPILDTKDQPIPQLPLLTWVEEDSQNFAAENKVWKKVQNYQFELYTNIKNSSVERQVEEVFDDNSIFYESDANWIKEERMHQMIYYITLFKK